MRIVDGRSIVDEGVGGQNELIHPCESGCFPKPTPKAPSYRSRPGCFVQAKLAGLDQDASLHVVCYVNISLAESESVHMCSRALGRAWTKAHKEDEQAQIDVGNWPFSAADVRVPL